MEIIDFVFLVVIGGFALFGLWFGFVHTLGSLIGTVIGAYLASRWYEPLSAWLVGLTGWDTNLARVIMFVIAFIIINRLVGFGFWIVDKLLSIVTKLPFIRSINRFLGLLLGIAEGMITLGLIIFFIERFPLSEHFMGWLAASAFAPGLSALAAILWPLLPDALRLLESTVNYVSEGVSEFAAPALP